MTAQVVAFPKSPSERMLSPSRARKLRRLLSEVEIEFYAHPEIKEQTASADRQFEILAELVFAWKRTHGYSA